MPQIMTHLRGKVQSSENEMMRSNERMTPCTPISCQPAKFPLASSTLEQPGSVLGHQSPPRMRYPRPVQRYAFGIDGRPGVYRGATLFADTRDHLAHSILSEMTGCEWVNEYSDRWPLYRCWSEAERDAHAHEVAEDLRKTGPKPREYPSMRHSISNTGRSTRCTR